MIQSPFSRFSAGLQFFRTRSFVAWTLLALLLTSWPARANDPDSDYTSVYITITAADDLNKKGDVVKAREKYIQAQQELTAFQQANPTWNNQIVSFRLSYLAEKIAATQKSETAAKVKAEANAAANKAAAEAAPKVEVALVDAGAEPRQTLRLHPQVGDKQTIMVTMTKVVETGVDGQEPQATKSPGLKSTLEVTVKEVSATGDITYEAVLTDVDLAGNVEDLGEDADRMKAALSAAKGVMRIVTVSDRGTIKSSRMEAPAGSDPRLAKAVDQMKEMFPDIVASLPEEAVGMGAKWTATEHSKSDGISIESIDTLEVTSIKDNIVTVKIKTTMSAPPQTVSNPAMPGMKLNVVRMAGKGSGNISFDPAQTMPLKGNMNLVSDGTMEMKQGGQKKTMTVKTQDIITFEAK